MDFLLMRRRRRIGRLERSCEGWECLVKQAPGHVATAAGFTLEDVDGLAGEKVEKGKAFMVVVGWDSVDSHTAFRRMGGIEKLVLRVEGWKCIMLSLS